MGGMVTGHIGDIIGTGGTAIAHSGDIGITAPMVIAHTGDIITVTDPGSPPREQALHCLCVRVRPSHIAPASSKF
jgi:hypothetical protein